MINFLKQIFTWWNKKTIGTFFYTLIKGKYAGSDEFDNRYYTSSEGKRWVIYNDRVESSKIPPEWHLWIHFLTDKKPDEKATRFKWQKKHEENLTGTPNAYKPEGSLSSNPKKNIKKYEVWKV
tara:strand:- start:298 stop:666 length:369 start_codon:yes stop_codon:yes gene_type:complete